MALRVLLYFGLLAFGWLLSSKGKVHENLMKKLSFIQSLILFGLIFTMGVRIGMDEQVLSSIGKIGLTAAAFGLVTTLLSILFVYFARKRFISDTNITGGRHD